MRMFLIEWTTNWVNSFNDRLVMRTAGIVIINVCFLAYSMVHKVLFVFRGHLFLNCLWDDAVLKRERTILRKIKSFQITMGRVRGWSLKR